MSDKDERGKFAKGNSYAPKKGEVRNPNGRPKGASIHRKLRELLEGEEGEKVEEAIARAGIKHAVKGNPRFWQMVVEIIDGKVPDRIAGHDGGAVQFDAESLARVRKLVEAADRVDDPD
jgi:hypothetical protein